MSTLNRKCLILPAVAILALVYAGFVSVSSARQEEGYQPAGSWVWSISMGGVPSPAFVTLHSDGTVSVSSASMFNSPGHGAWVRTGPKSFGGTTLYMRHDASGNLLGFMRARTALHFVDDPDHIEGLIYVEIGQACAPPSGCPDPLSPDAIWTATTVTPVPLSGTRIHRVEIPEQESFQQ